MKANTEYRYFGSNDSVKNYVRFNNELWRIIGVFEVDNGSGVYENRVKLIRNESIGKFSYDTSEKGINDFIYQGVQYYGGGTNQWGASSNYPGASLMWLINPGYTGISGSLYYDSQSGTCYNGYNNATKTCNFKENGLKNEAKRMIADAKWYTAGTPWEYSTYSIYHDADQTYKEERGNLTYYENSSVAAQRTTSWVGKVALMYASDYAYAASCYKGKYTWSDGNTNTIALCKNENWLFSNELKWALTPLVSDGRRVRQVWLDGGICDGSAASPSLNVYPSLYLKSSIKITGGNGTSTNPYQLCL